MEITQEHSAKNRGIILFLVFVSLFQIYITYISYREGNSNVLAENIIWPYFIFALIIGAVTDKLYTPQFGFLVSFVGFIILAGVNVLYPSTEKITFALLLALFSIYYGIMYARTH